MQVLKGREAKMWACVERVMGQVSQCLTQALGQGAEKALCQTHLVSLASCQPKSPGW